MTMWTAIFFLLQLILHWCKYIRNSSYIWTAVIDESEEWSSQWIFQFKQTGKKKPEKNQGFNRIRTRDLRDAGAMLYQLSYEATHCSSLSSITAVQIYELFHIYLHHFTPHGKIWTQQIDLAPNVWLNSSVGRASHRYRGGHGFEFR